MEEIPDACKILQKKNPKSFRSSFWRSILIWFKRIALLFLSTALNPFIAYIEWNNGFWCLLNEAQIQQVDHLLCSFSYFVTVRWIRRCWLACAYTLQTGFLFFWVFWYSQTKMKIIFYFFASISIFHVMAVDRWCPK